METQLQQEKNLHSGLEKVSRAGNWASCTSGGWLHREKKDWGRDKVSHPNPTPLDTTCI